MRVLVACERTQRVTAEFRARGHDAFSCDIEPTAGRKEWHLRGDARQYLNDGWDLLIAHPPCTRLCNSGVQHRKGEKRRAEFAAAVDLFLAFWNAPVPRVVIENPIPSGYTIDAIGRYYNQIVHPHFFGDPAFKATCLWLKAVPELKRTHHLPIPAKGTPEWEEWNKIHKMAQSKKRAEKRSETFPGIARAFAEQWGALQ